MRPSTASGRTPLTVVRPARGPGLAANRWRRVVVVTIVIQFVLSGCTSTQPPGLGEQPQHGGELEPVTVERGNIASVLTVDAVIVSLPEYVVSARVAGAVRRSFGITDGKPVRQGTTIGWQGDEALVAPVGGALVRWQGGYLEFVCWREGSCRT